MSKVSEKLGLYIEVGSDSEGEDWEQKEIEREEQHIMDFIRNNPFPDRDTFVDIQLETVRKDKATGIKVFGTTYDYRILNKLYENIMNKDIVRECGRELYEKDGMRDMVRCHTLFNEIIHYNYNKGDNKENYDRTMIIPLARLVEHYWDGIGMWKA